MKRLSVFCFALAAGAGAAWALEARRETRVDAEGVWRWSDGGDEVALVGVNLYTPFTVDYAELKRRGADHRQAIRDDVAHLRRLGLGCVRIHCFDREFSDAAGNLVDNEHLALLDFLIDECGRNGLYTVLTPIAWWGGHYAPGSIRGFSDIYDMRQMTTDPQAWAAQARFLRQFAEHVNRHTGLRYADDPRVLAFECINEPLYPPGTPDERVTAYINTLADALRASGTRKPVFYNSWQGRNAAAGAARVEGVTCSSYPTGLVAGHALAGSQAGRVRGSSLQPSDAIRAKARMAYEFDAADVPGSHMYPLMAKLFRSEGLQVASQFQYDLLALAAENPNWQTHHLNLVYTPGKALSLAIAAEVFRRVPRGGVYGAQPEASHFPPFRVSGEEDLSELVTREEFLSSNATSTRPPEPAALRRVWGCGASPVVEYAGTGAYFLDRAASGVWRLQLYPDVFEAADPYTGQPGVKVRALPGARPFRVRLPDLGEAPEVCDLAGGGRAALGALAPGDWLLVRRGRALDAAARAAAAEVAPRYVAPALAPLERPLVRGQAPGQALAGRPLRLVAEAAFPLGIVGEGATGGTRGTGGQAVRARLVCEGGAFAEAAVELRQEAAFRYAGDVPAEALGPGRWRVSYEAVERVGEARGSTVGEGGLLRVVGASDAWNLFDAEAWLKPRHDGGGMQRTRSKDDAGRVAMRASVRGFGAALDSVSCRTACEPVPAAFFASAAPGDRGLPNGAPQDGGAGEAGATILVRARAAHPTTVRVELVFVQEDGRPWGAVVPLTSEWRTVRLPVRELRFFKHWGAWADQPPGEHLRVTRLAAVNLCFGRWLYPQCPGEPHAFEIAEIAVER